MASAENNEVNLSGGGDTKDSGSLHAKQSEVWAAEGRVEHVYPEYLRKGPGRALLALTISMRDSCPMQRPTCSSILKQIRDATCP